jgi:hypothetical protein
MGGAVVSGPVFRRSDGSPPLVGQVGRQPVFHFGQAHAAASGALVTIRDAQLGDCHDNQDYDFVETSPDGSFALPALPRGQYTLGLSHSDYAERSFQVRHPGARRSLVVDRGASWRGVLHSPDGRVLTPDEMFFATGSKVPDELALARINARAARMTAHRGLSCERCQEELCVVLEEPIPD